MPLNLWYCVRATQQTKTEHSKSIMEKQYFSLTDSKMYYKTRVIIPVELVLEKTVQTVELKGELRNRPMHLGTECTRALYRKDKVLNACLGKAG